MAIIRLDEYFQFMLESEISFISNGIPWTCTQLNNLYNRLVRGETIQPTNLDLSNLTFNDVTVDISKTNLSNNLSLFVNSINRFENQGYVSNESYLTTAVSESVTNTISTSNTTGFKFTEKISASAKFDAKIPLIGEASSTVGFEVAFEQNLSTTVTETTSRTITISVPSQPVTVRPRTRKTVAIQLYRLDSPSLLTSTSGYVAGSVASRNIYDALNTINTKCPQIYVNRDDLLRLDSNRRALRFKGAGTAKISAVSLDFIISTREEDLNTGAVIAIDNEVKRASIQV